MTNTRCFRCIALLALLAPAITHAELGGKAASVQADLVQMNAGVIHAATTSPNFSVQQIQTPNGITIKEFISSAGTVFAVTWQGPQMPDLRQLLGQYFNDYVSAAKNNRDGHSQLGIQTADLVVQASGYVRAFSGIAYLPGLMPPGVSVAQLH